MKLETLVFVAALCLIGCTNSPTHQNNPVGTGKQVIEVRYAKGFRINRFKDCNQLIVRNPWDSTKVLDSYVLVDRNKQLPAHLPEGILVRTPIERVAFCSSVHAGMWERLKKAYLTVGVCEAASPEILIVSPFENTKRTEFEKIKLVVVKDASYMEDSPLGRAEWIKFEAAFTNQDRLADKIFTDIEKKYKVLCRKVATTTSRPTVFTEKKFGDIWYIAGGKSFIGSFLKDAGAHYIWKDLNQTGSTPFSFEKVYEKAVSADYWLLNYNNKQRYMTYEALKNEYPLYANFNAYKMKQIFAINTAKNSFYEAGPMEPDRVLADLVYIFHHELLPGYKPAYYFNLIK